MPAIRSALILLDEYLTKTITLRNALMRERLVKSMAEWDEISLSILKLRDTVTNELGINKNGPVSKLDVAIMAAKEKYARKSNKNTTIMQNMERIWKANTKEEARTIANTLNLNEDQFNKVLSHRPTSYSPYKIERPTNVQLQNVKHQPSPPAENVNHNTINANHNTAEEIDDTTSVPEEMDPEFAEMFGLAKK